MSKRSFASDNNAGVHPEIIKAIKAANEGHVIAYGNDPFTARAIKQFQKHFGSDIAVYFVFGGTGANVLGLKAITKSHQAIVCADTAHVNVDECGAPENFTGCKLLPIPTTDGKLRVELIKPLLLHGIGVEHYVQPGVISVSQATEMGTVYTKKELKTLASFAHDNGMLLHVDGARMANAAVSLGATSERNQCDVGVDVLSFGGTKNGMMYGEAVIFFNQKLAADFKYIRKQGMHLPSKMRFIAAQFEALLVRQSLAARRHTLEPNGTHTGQPIGKVVADQDNSTSGIKRCLRSNTKEAHTGVAEEVFLLYLERRDF